MPIPAIEAVMTMREGSSRVARLRSRGANLHIGCQLGIVDHLLPDHQDLLLSADKDTLDIEIHNLLKRRLGMLVKRGTPGRAGVR